MARPRVNPKSDLYLALLDCVSDVRVADTKGEFESLAHRLFLLSRQAKVIARTQPVLPTSGEPAVQSGEMLDD